MNDKEKKYSHIDEISDRPFIDKIPNENDLAKYEEWKKIIRNERLKKRMVVWTTAFIGSLMISFFMIRLAKWTDHVTTTFSTSDTGDQWIYYIIIMLTLLANMLALGFIIREYIKSKSWKMDYCKYGKVIDKYIVIKRYANGRGRIKRDYQYYAIVSIDEQLLKIRIRSIKNYYSLEINEDPMVFFNDNAIVFFIEGKNELNVIKK